MTPQERSRYQSKVQLHFADGGEVEFRQYPDDSWLSAKHPKWDWVHMEYRIKSEKSQSEIDRDENIVILSHTLLGYWTGRGLYCPLREERLAKYLYNVGYRKLSNPVDNNSFI